MPPSLPQATRDPTPAPDSPPLDESSQDSGCGTESVQQPSSQPAGPARPTSLPVYFSEWTRPTDLPADIDWPLPASYLAAPHGPPPPGCSDTIDEWPPPTRYHEIPFNLSIRERSELRYVEEGGVATAAAQSVLQDIATRRERLDLKNLRLYDRTLASDAGIVRELPPPPPPLPHPPSHTLAFGSHAFDFFIAASTHSRTPAGCAPPSQGSLSTRERTYRARPGAVDSRRQRPASRPGWPLTATCRCSTQRRPCCANPAGNRLGRRARLRAARRTAPTRPAARR